MVKNSSSSAFKRRFRQLRRVYQADRQKIRRQLMQLEKRTQSGRGDETDFSEVDRKIAVSINRVERRLSSVPELKFDEQLPINQKREDIADLIKRHQVVIVCGETGSGKTTQLPKICLSIGRGARGYIGHTQPRRIAAQSVGRRIAEELGTEFGQEVGFKVRFQEHFSKDGYIKLMTDGVLLAETQHDRFLNAYDTLIIDEAHERSLNIDFILGYLKKILPRRPDLKVIITSATIDPQRFSRHFDNAPVVEVSGRMYPVEVEYLEEDFEEKDISAAVLEAMQRVNAIDPRGDVLVFLSGERDIREVEKALKGSDVAHHSEVMPLFARLSTSQQQKIFQPCARRKIVLSTNVAETSLTVPGIRFVIDSGLARISRYSYRTKVQRLPIEKISQASANQRKGRCGRIASGVCIRLYDEKDFQVRPEFTEPEIQRTNLASVILQMKALKLGDIESFPFVDPPDGRFIRDGLRLLDEIGAIKEDETLTELGRELSRLPIDLRVGRFLLEAEKKGCLHEALIIGAFQEIRDPRESDEINQQSIKEHKQVQSDLQVILALWNQYQAVKTEQSGSQLRKWCKANKLVYMHMREWNDLYHQVASYFPASKKKRSLTSNYETLHRALLSGFISFVGTKEEDRYLGIRNVRFRIFPASMLARKQPKWIVATQLIETSSIFAHQVAKVEPGWIEDAAGDLVKKDYFEPFWDEKTGDVFAYERVTLYGLVLVAKRRVRFGPVDPVTSRQVFIREALATRVYRSNADFDRHNRNLLKELDRKEHKERRKGFVLEDILFDFFDRVIPDDGSVFDARSFEHWRKQAERKQPRLLFIDRSIFDVAESPQGEYPDTMQVGDVTVPLKYHFEPGASDDGVTAIVKVADLNSIRSERFGWLVPGLIEKKLVALIKSLPKQTRKYFVPAPDFARAALERMPFGKGDLLQAFAKVLYEITGVRVPGDLWDASVIDDHLRMNVRVLGGNKKVLAEGRDFQSVRHKALAGYESYLSESAFAMQSDGESKDWVFEDIPEQTEYVDKGMKITAYPALAASDEGVSMQAFATHEQALRHHREAIEKLLYFNLRERVRKLPNKTKDYSSLALWYGRLVSGKGDLLAEHLAMSVIQQLVAEEALPRTRSEFEKTTARVKRKFETSLQKLLALVREIYTAELKLDEELKRIHAFAWSKNVVPFVLAYKDSLLSASFVRRTSWRRLENIPRYLEAALVHLKKFPSKEKQYLELQTQYNELVDEYRALCEKSAVETQTAGLAKIRGLLDELYVSLFAQEVGVRESVSVKRIMKMMDEL